MLYIINMLQTKYYYYKKDTNWREYCCNGKAVIYYYIPILVMIATITLVAVTKEMIFLSLLSIPAFYYLCIYPIYDKEEGTLTEIFDYIISSSTNELKKLYTKIDLNDEIEPIVVFTYWNSTSNTKYTNTQDISNALYGNMKDITVHINTHVNGLFIRDENTFIYKNKCDRYSFTCCCNNNTHVYLNIGYTAHV
jgi:hypothetical protein